MGDVLLAVYGGAVDYYFLHDLDYFEKQPVQQGVMANILFVESSEILKIKIEKDMIYKFLVISVDTPVRRGSPLAMS